MSILTNSRERQRFLRFAVVGAVGAVVDFGVANALRRFLNIPLVPAGTVSFICAVLSNFTWNRYWTYPDSRSKAVLRQLMEFAVVSVAGLMIRVPILHFLEPPVVRFFVVLPFRFAVLTPQDLGANFTLAIAIVVVMFWNFYVNRYWTYRDAR